MKGPYSGLWFLLTVGFAIFFVMSAFGGIKIGAVELESSEFYAELTKIGTVEKADVMTATEGVLTADVETEDVETDDVEEPRFVVDTMPQRILFIGDSMLEGLSPRLAAYAKHNGHKLYSIIWYGSTTKVWGNSDKLAKYIATYDPTFIFVSLGGNEMFVRDIKTRHLEPLKSILSQLGDIPYQWIAPPNWKPDTGINELLAENIPASRLFVSKDLTLARASDKVHPTRTAAYGWFDLIVAWMAENQDYRIKLETPQVQTAKPDKLEALAPPK